MQLNGPDHVSHSRSTQLGISRCSPGFYPNIFQSVSCTWWSRFVPFSSIFMYVILFQPICLILQIVHLFDRYPIDSLVNNGGSSSFRQLLINSLRWQPMHCWILKHTQRHAHSGPCWMIELYDYGLSLYDLCICNWSTAKLTVLKTSQHLFRAVHGHLETRLAFFLFLHNVSFVLSSNSCKFIVKLYKLCISKAFQDKYDTSEVILKFWRMHPLPFFLFWRDILSWYLLICSHRAVSAMDQMLLLNARPSSSIVEKVMIYEKKEICNSHLH